MFAPASMMLVGAVVTLGRKSIQNCLQLEHKKSDFNIFDFARESIEENAVVPKQLIEWPPHDSPPS
jgi:hypothetical protein